MAPTKPLVAQQIEACYNIMGIPQEHTAEMTGLWTKTTARTLNILFWITSMFTDLFLKQTPSDCPENPMSQNVYDVK